MTDKPGENTPPKQNGLKAPWKPGESGNPAGRPKGAKNKLSEAFFVDLHELWKTEGADALKKALAKDPVAFCRMVAALMPKNLDDESQARMASIEASLGLSGRLH